MINITHYLAIASCAALLNISLVSSFSFQYKLHPFLISRYQHLYVRHCYLEESIRSDLEKLDMFTPVKLSEQFSSISSSIGKKTTVTCSCEAFIGRDHIRYLRIIQFLGANCSVLNILGLPYVSNNLPILGIDIVKLPGGTIIAADLQPCQPGHFEGDFNSQVNKHLELIHSKWAKVFPSSGPLPTQLQPYFSPMAIFSRMPPSSTDVVVDNLNLRHLILDYINLYKMLIAESVNDESGSQALAATRSGLLKQYIDYRIAKDPAKNLLVSAFGTVWTEDALNQVFFPHDTDPPSHPKVNRLDYHH